MKIFHFIYSSYSIKILGTYCFIPKENLLNEKVFHFIWQVI